MHLPEHLRLAYTERRPAILARLADFQRVPRDDWFYELAFCVLTPQSKALHANLVIEQLKQMRFREVGGDPTPVLRNPSQYIRFHNTKASRLVDLREQWTDIEALIDSSETARSRRDLLAQTIKGIGMKEASHFLRNVGVRGLAIIDRHLISNLQQCQVIDEHVRVSTYSSYRNVEDRFEQFAASVGIDMDELDLLFWSSVTGIILK